MSSEFRFAVCAVFVGVGATLLLDAWTIVRRRFFGIRSLDLRLLGRWIGHIPQGRLVHQDVSKSASIRGEAIIGWLAHYGIGCTFAALLLKIYGIEWAQQPTALPALIVGLGTVAAPFFVMQPCLGLGIAGSRTPNPKLTRLRNTLTHLVFGVGLYASGLAWAALTR